MADRPAETREFRVIALLGPGRAGTTLLRNELLKPAEVTCLSSEGGFRWFEANRELLGLEDPTVLARAHARLAVQWQSEGFDKEDLKLQFAAAPPESVLTHRLLVKMALIRFAGEGRGRFRNVHVIRLSRDPLAIVASMCRPLPWNEGHAFWSGPRANLLFERTADLGALARSEGLEHAPLAPEDVAKLPYHIACASWVADYFLVDDELRARTTFCARSIDVRFEDLLSDRDKQLQRLASFMGIERPDFPPNRVYFRPVEGEGGIASNQDTGANGRGQGGHDFSDAFTDAQRSEVLEVLAEVRVRLGYGDRQRSAASR